MKTFFMKNRSGFTLVELLIVVALIGALAVGLIAVIDPIEQIRRGQDAGVRNLAREYTQAEQRYFTTRGAFTWGATTPSAVALNTLTDAGESVTLLQTAGELKSNFVSQAGTNLSKIYLSGNASSYSVCFQPASKSMQTDPATTFTQTGAQAAAGACGLPTSTCYMCFQ